MRQEKDNGFVISDDKVLLQRDKVYQYLSQDSYWAKEIPRAVFEQSVENSLCFGAYIGMEQVGFCRVISDFATFGYLADVFVSSDYRSRGISKKLMASVMSHPKLQTLRRIVLVTADAHELYRQYGYTNLSQPQNFMEFHRPNVYQSV